MKQEIERFLMAQNRELQILSDDLLQPGSEWGVALSNMRNEADVFISLVSRPYLESKTVASELPQILQKVREGKAYVLPVIVERCDWHNHELSKYQAVPKFGQPFSEFTDRHAALLEIATAVEQLGKLKQNTKAVQLIKAEKERQTGTLNLEACDLQTIPRDLLEMPWLTMVNLNKNYIEKIENLDNLARLSELSLIANKIKTIENLERAEQLTLLDLKSNRIHNIENLIHNTQLKTLGLTSNNITSLTGLETLEKLETLYLSHNQIEDIDVLKELRGLKRIVLTNNAIKSIKPLLFHIKSGLNVFFTYSFNPDEAGIFIKDNKMLSEPAVEVIEKGTGAILKYFGDAETYGTRKLEIVKLILVGNSKVGKTNLSEFIRGGPITASHQSTHLLDICMWKDTFLKSEDGSCISINIFDFGGQDYYHDSHRLYYSHDTAYILVWDTTTNRYSEETEKDGQTGDDFFYENYPLPYWLESINYNLTKKERHHFANKAQEEDKKKAANNPPILILQNKIDIQEGRLDQQALSDKYQNIAGFFNMSLKAPKRTEVLVGVLDDYMRTLNLSGRQLIEYEYKIIQDHLQHPRPFAAISLQAFWEECKNIINDPEIPFNKDNAHIIATILNSLGILFYDKESGPEGIIFTKITRLNELIKQVMDIAKKGNDKGLFSRDQIGAMQNRDEVLNLLSKNNSIIALNDNQFLVPQFLPLRPDASIEFFLSAFCYLQVRFIYKAYFHKTLLLSLFSKYVQESKTGQSTPLGTPLFWRNGIVIQRGDRANRQMVFVEFVKTAACGIINIKTMKPFNKRGLEKEIETTLDELNQGWTVIKEIASNSVDFFDITYLKEEIEKGIFEFGTNGNIFSANDFKPIADFEKMPKKLFISYSSKNAEFIRRFITHLEVLKSGNLIEPWYDRMIESGTRWDEAIRKEMKNSDIIIFLLSPDFLATDYIMKTEIPLAIEQMQSEVSKFFFIELQPCGWKRTILADYQQTDNSGVAAKNVISIGTPENDAEWNKVIDELVDKIKE